MNVQAHRGFVTSDWNVGNMPSQTGRVAVITGTGGLGYEIGLALAHGGATVILAGRNQNKGGESVDRIRLQRPAGTVRFEHLDLADLSSIAAFAQRMGSSSEHIDLLINNAGVMTPPTRRTTADGFELQFGTNYLGHFALTAQLLPLLVRGVRPRVVSVSSLVHLVGAINFEDLQFEKKYNAAAAYGQSKLANLLFAFELQRRSQSAGWGLMSNAAHPGSAQTELLANGPGAGSLGARITSRLQPWIGHSAADGALPELFAATSPDAQGCAYYGPSRLFGMKGPPGPARASKRAHDTEVARQLWDVSQQLTGVRFGEPGHK